MKYLISICILTVFWSCHTRETPVEDSTFIVKGEKGLLIDSLLTPYVKQLNSEIDNSAALAIGVTYKGEIVYARTFGYAQVESQLAANVYTPFHIASLSKPFTAVAIAQLVEQGKLKLDDKLVTYLPEFSEIPDERYEQITIRQVLTHTSGIPRNIAPDDWLNPSYGPNALAENLEIIKDHELDFIPGVKFDYSNSAFDILGVVISRVSGMPFHDYVTANIFAPAGMQNSSFIKPANELPVNWAPPYSYGLVTQRWSPYPYNERLFPSSGVVSSLKDMCKWGLIHLGQGSYQNQQILTKATFDTLIAPHFMTPWGDEIGLSWFLQSYLDRPIIMHTGADTGFESIIYIYPTEDISIVVLANRDFARTGRIINAASEVLFNETPKSYDLSAKYRFAAVYKQAGIEEASKVWFSMKADTTDNYYVDDDDILTTGAILENGKEWKSAKEVLAFYLSLNDASTYAWRLLGNANLGLNDTIAARQCYEQTLVINPNYTKGKLALENLQNNIND